MREFVVIVSFFTYLTIVHAQMSPKEVRPSNTMMLISGGVFIMGSNDGPDDEKPQHTIFLKPAIPGGHQMLSIACCMNNNV
jgi:formylglycine-generating enzyme required for sulfatase activity